MKKVILIFLLTAFGGAALVLTEIYLIEGPFDPGPHFTDNGDGTVTDNRSGLIWLKNPDRLGKRTRANALTDCKNLSSGVSGLSDDSTPGDWRLPTIKEFKSLFDTGDYNPVLPHDHPFTVARSGCFWIHPSDMINQIDGMYKYMGEGGAGLAGIILCYQKYHDDGPDARFHVWPARKKKGPGSSFGGRR